MSPDALSDLASYLDGDLRDDREADLLRRLADEPEARALLRQEIFVRRTLSRADHADAQVPPGFTDRIMARLPELPRPTPPTAADRPALRASVRSTTWGAARAGATARHIARYGALTAAVIAGLFIGLLLPFSSESVAPEATPVSLASTTEVETVWVPFYYADPTASSVAVIGDFSRWEPVPLQARRVGNTTVWTGLVPVGRGEHRYMFLVDGDILVTDPLAPLQQDDGFGNQNAVLAL
jgi:hypothetical protein